MENNGENSGPLTSLPVDRLTATDCNAAARAKMMEIVATNVIASRPPERRPTATPTLVPIVSTVQSLEAIQYSF